MSNNENFPKSEKYKILIDFIKWFVVSVVLAVAALLINYSIQSREQGLREVTEYDKYIEILVYNDNIGAKIKLAEFFSIITTSREIRERWTAYLVILKAEAKEYEREEASTEAELEKLREKAKEQELTEKETMKVEKLEKKKTDIEFQLSKKIKIPPIILKGNIIKETLVEEQPEEEGAGERESESPLKRKIIRQK